MRLKSKLKICKTPGCGKPHKAKGYCISCYNKFIISIAKDKGEYKEIDGKLVKVATCEVCGEEFIKTGRNKICSKKECSEVASKKYHQNYYNQDEQKKELRKILKDIKTKEFKTTVMYLISELHEANNKDAYSIIYNALNLIATKQGYVKLLEYLNSCSYKNNQ